MKTDLFQSCGHYCWPPESGNIGVSLGSSKYQGTRQEYGLLVGKHQPSESHGTRNANPPDLHSKAVEQCRLVVTTDVREPDMWMLPLKQQGNSMGVAPTCLHPGG